MPHTVRLDHANGLVEVVYTGELTAAERAATIVGASHLVADAQLRRLIVDLRQARILVEPTHVLAQLAHTMAHVPAIQSSRLAYLVTQDQEANRIVENMALARHMVVARFFERDDALAWLLDAAEG